MGDQACDQADTKQEVSEDSVKNGHSSIYDVDNRFFQKADNKHASILSNAMLGVSCVQRGSHSLKVRSALRSHTCSRQRTWQAVTHPRGSANGELINKLVRLQLNGRQGQRVMDVSSQRHRYTLNNTPTRSS